MRYVSAAAFVTLSSIIPSVVFAQVDTSLSITNYQFLSEQRVSQTQSSVTYRADLVNMKGAFGSVTATLTILDPYRPFRARSEHVEFCAGTGKQPGNQQQYLHHPGGPHCSV